MEPDELRQAWDSTDQRLPLGWQLNGLRCASTSLHAEDRSTDWIAAALGPDGEERTARASDPVAALDRLAESFQPR